jgi:hypothetical protein
LLRKPFPRIFQSDFKHCAAAIESTIIKNSWVMRFHFAMAQVIDNFPFITTLPTKFSMFIAQSAYL